MKITLYIAAALLIVSLQACVSAKVHDALKKEKLSVDDELAKYKIDHNNLLLRNNELVKQLKEEKDIAQLLSSDTTNLAFELRKAKDKYEELNQTCEKLIENHASETKKLMLKLKDTQEDIHTRESKLTKLENEINRKEIKSQALRDSLLVMQNDLQKRESKLLELENILYRKDSAVNALKGTISQALLGFKDKGLSIVLKNGKVYILLEEELLFKSGSAVVDTKGIEALSELAKVLSQHNDINILIEGHTDDVPFKGSGNLKDNWDLSVKRATSVVRIIQEKGVKPERLTPAGRSEYAPLIAEKTAEARKKNRRIEIILTPKLDELFQLLE